MATRIKAGQAQIVEMQARTMAVVRSVGEPETVAESVFGALYGAVYNLKFALKKSGVDYGVEPPRARWMNPESTPRDQWRALWGIPVPEGTTEVFQKIADVPVEIEVWDYGPVAQILHVGSYADETPTVERLLGFIDEAGYEVAGPHEEEYISRPGAKEQKTIIRYQVRQRKKRRRSKK